MRSSLTITSSSVSGIVMIVYPAFVVRRDVKASSIRALSSKNKAVQISASVLFFSVAPILSLSLRFLSPSSDVSIVCLPRVRKSPAFLASVSGGARISVVPASMDGKHVGVISSGVLFLYRVDGIFDHMIGHVVFVPYANGIRGLLGSGM